MYKLILHVLAEISIGLALAGLLLGTSVPLLMKTGIITVGDRTGTIIITTTLLAAVVVMVFRPGSALNSRAK